jgi:hypothetical protein
MKIKKVTEMLAVAGMMFLSGASQHAYGQAEKTGNGGEGYEAEFSGFKSEIMVWVNKTELKDLSLDAINGEALIKTLNSQIVHVSFVDQDLMVGTKKRTCKNYPEQSLIECQKSAWSNETTQTKYTLVFHELLGLAGAETNIGEESDYKISGQIRDFIQAKTMYTLSPIRLSNSVIDGITCNFTKNWARRWNFKGTKSGLLVVYPDGTLFLRKNKHPIGATGEFRCRTGGTNCHLTGTYRFLQVLNQKGKKYDSGEGKLNLDQWHTLEQTTQIIDIGGSRRRISIYMPPKDNYKLDVGNNTTEYKTGFLIEETMDEKFQYRVVAREEYSCQWMEIYKAANLEARKQEMRESWLK